MSCICMNDTPINGPYYPLNIKKHIKYDKIINYHYEGHEGYGGYTCNYLPVETDAEIFLRVNYPILYETDGNEYMKRIFHCPLCNRYFPPQSIWEKEQEKYEFK